MEHVEVSLTRAKARARADLWDRFFHFCRPHRVVRLAAVDDIVKSLRFGIDTHGCRPKCAVCRWAAHVIAGLWRT
jgi:hypothetical protein